MVWPTTWEISIDNHIQQELKIVRVFFTGDVTPSLVFCNYLLGLCKTPIAFFFFAFVFFCVCVECAVVDNVELYVVAEDKAAHLRYDKVKYKKQVPFHHYLSLVIF